MGGFDVLIYARLYRSEVVGMVLVDSAHPDLAKRMPELRPGLADWRRQLQWQEYAMPFGIPRLMGRCGDGPPELRSKLRTIECKVSRLKETIAECDSMWGKSAAQAGKTGTLGDIPLVVISAEYAHNMKGSSAPFYQGQNELAHLSTSSSRVMAEGSGHQIQKERPDLVIQAVKNVIEQSRQNALVVSYDR